MTFLKFKIYTKTLLEAPFCNFHICIEAIYIGYIKICTLYENNIQNLLIHAFR